MKQLVEHGFQESCRNYVRVLAKTAPGEVLVCGTNAYKPVCRKYISTVSTFNTKTNFLYSVFILKILQLIIQSGRENALRKIQLTTSISVRDI